MATALHPRELRVPETTPEMAIVVPIASATAIDMAAARCAPASAVRRSQLTIPNPISDAPKRRASSRPASGNWTPYGAAVSAGAKVNAIPNVIATKALTASSVLILIRDLLKAQTEPTLSTRLDEVETRRRRCESRRVSAERKPRNTQRRQRRRSDSGGEGCVPTNSAACVGRARVLNWKRCRGADCDHKPSPR